MDDVDVATEFATEPAGPSEGALSRVAKLANRLVSLEGQITEQQSKLKQLEEEHRLIAESHLPEAMDSCGDSGIRSLTLGDGSRLVVSTKYRCGQLDNLPDDPKRADRKPLGERQAALSWLEANSYGDLARRTITIVLGKASSDAERKIRAFFNSLRLNSARYLAANVVQWNTLSALARELDAGDTPAPLDKLGVSKVRVAEVKKAKHKDEL